MLADRPKWVPGPMKIRILKAQCPPVAHDALARLHHVNAGGQAKVGAWPHENQNLKSHCLPVAHDALARLHDVVAGGQVHQGVCPPHGGPGQLLHFLHACSGYV
eukprot:1160016-Pelagomonas_calceolata.AAC.2